MIIFRKYRLLSLILLQLLLIISNINSQQLPQFSQRMIDVLLYNPAYAGTKIHSEALLHYRKQWLGFENAPVTQSLSLNGKINRLMGIGFYFLKDEIGPFSNTKINLDYAHHIDMNGVTLVFGLGADFIQYGIDGSKISLYEMNDNSIELMVTDKKWKSDFSFGTYLYNDNFYFGMSVMQLLQSKVKLYLKYDKEGIVPLTNHYYLTSGFNFNVLSKFDIEPSLLVSKTIGSPFQIDLNLSGQYMQKFLAGFSYRYKDAFVIVAGAKIKDNYKLTYSYDLIVSPLKSYNSGSHEIILSVILPDLTNRKSRWHHEYKYDFNPKTNRWRERW